MSTPHPLQILARREIVDRSSGQQTVAESVPGRPGVYRLEPPAAFSLPEAAPGTLSALPQVCASLGFARVGVCAADALGDASLHLRQWLSRGYEGEMAYLRQPERGEPRALLSEARSVVVVALAYPNPPEQAPVAAYALGLDYHSVLKAKLLELAGWCAAACGRSVLARPCVDTAPLLERALAARAGVGFQGKSTLSIAPGVGSRFLLGELLLDVALPLTVPSPHASGCGECTRCLDACPTQAFVAPYVLDSRRCISYLTIEYGGSIPESLRPGIGERVFGCDVCQSVCPYNASRKLPDAAPELLPEAVGPFPDFETLLTMGSGAYRRLVKQRALGRISRIRLQRNAAIALGNRRDPQSLPVLGAALLSHPHPLVREHIAWALGRFGSEVAKEYLRKARASEAESTVRAALDRALAAGTLASPPSGP